MTSRTTKAAIANFTPALAEFYGGRDTRANSVVAGQIWTTLIPSTMPAEQVEGQQVRWGRPGQPAELVPIYAMLASDEAGYVFGARVAVTAGTPIL